MEYTAPVFYSTKTKEQGRVNEMVQKKALAIILGNSYLSYEFALSELNLERLDDRRLQL